MVLPVTQASVAYAAEVAVTLKRANAPVQLDMRDMALSLRLKDHVENRVPVLAVVGKESVRDRTVQLRVLGSNAPMTLPLDKLTQFYTHLTTVSA